MAARKKKKGLGCFPALLLVVAMIVGGALGYSWLSGKSVGQSWQQLQSVTTGLIDRITSGEGLLVDPHKDKEVAYRFAILADTHEDTTVFPKIVQKISEREDLSFVVAMGDISNAGEVSKLAEAKQYLDNIAVPVHVLPGDHDRNWLPERDLRNFKQVFGLTATSRSFQKGNEVYILIDNSDSLNGVSQSDWRWLEGVLDASKGKNMYVFMSTPLYNPYLSFKAMGSQSQKVKEQAGELGALLASAGVRAIFAGDTHSFSKYKDDTNELEVVTVGAAGTNKNLLPLYVEVEIFTDGSYNAKSIPYQDKE